MDLSSPAIENCINKEISCLERPKGWVSKWVRKIKDIKFQDQPKKGCALERKGIYFSWEISCLTTLKCNLCIIFLLSMFPSTCHTFWSLLWLIVQKKVTYGLLLTRIFKAHNIDLSDETLLWLLRNTSMALCLHQSFLWTILEWVKSLLCSPLSLRFWVLLFMICAWKLREK